MTQPDIEITGFRWVPPFARGLVRELRVRWALEELGFPYRTRLIEFQPREEEYYLEQPFGQVPAYRQGDFHLFESGAILLHLAERSEVLLPRDPVAKARATCWLIAALNTVEPLIFELVTIDVFNRDQEWARLRRPALVERLRGRIFRLSNWLDEKPFLEDQFTVADLIWTTVLRNLRDTNLVAERPNLAAWVGRCEARPAFERALAAQLADFEDREEA